jgi:hypothetical protein
MAPPQSPIRAIAATQVLFPVHPYLAQNPSPPSYIRVPIVQTCLHSENDTSIGKSLDIPNQKTWT